ncbi:MAG: hypothetical protein V4727_09835 [Verrucomicrobiota bacterium]
MIFKGSKLIIIEGPDGAGKSTIASSLIERLKELQIPAEKYSFPGRTANTLGQWVYDVHHNNVSKGIRPVSPSALQALHIAAHIDTIEQDIVPLLRKGVTIVVDRYWWSTWVYGVASGVAQTTLSHLIEAEKAVWGDYLPDCAFLISRPVSLNEDTSSWASLSSLYRSIASQESHFYPVHNIENILTVELAVSAITEFIYSPFQ